MVKLRTPTVQRATVIKPARHRRSSPLSREPHCLWPGCGANLAHDHDGQVCGCHPDPRIPYHRDDRIVLHLLLAAYPEAADLCGILRCTHHEVQTTIRRLRRRGHVIEGARRGYVYEVCEGQWR